MKRFKLLMLLVILISSASWNRTTADTSIELEKYLVKDQPLTYDVLKAGDTLVFNSAMYNYNKTNPQQDVPNLFLCGRYYTSTWGAKGSTLGVLTGLTSDNIFTLEEAPVQKVALAEDDTLEHKSFYIKHCDSEKYVTCDLSAWTAVLTEDKTAATSFSIESIDGWPAAGGGYNDYITDATLALVHYVNTSGSAAFLGPAWNYGFSQYSSTAKDCIVWNAFSVKYDYSALANLQHFYNEIKNNAYVAGTNPGQYPEDKVVKYMNIFETVTDAINVGTSTDDEFLTLYKGLKEAYEDVDSSMITLTDGYYYVVSAYDQFSAVSGVETAWRGYEDNLLYWETLDTTNPRYVFKITQVDGDNYTVENYAYSKYVNFYSSNIQQFIELADSVDNYQQISYGGSGMYRFKNENTPRYYYVDAFAYGARTKGHVGCNSNSYDASTYGWYLRRVPQETIESMAAEVSQIRLTGQLSNLLDDANTTYNAAFTYDADKENGLITNYSEVAEESQITSVYTITGSVPNLNDNDYSTYFRASASGSTDGYCNFIVNLTETPVETCVFKMAKVNTTAGQNERPTILTIYARNDVEEDWTKIERMNLPTQEAIMEFYRGVSLGASYKYLRFDVEEIYSGGRSSGYPYFSISEFQIYPATLNEEFSQYSYGEGVKAACDHLLEIMTASRAAVTENTATQAQYENLLAAINAVKPLLADSNDLVNDITKTQEYVALYGAGTEFGQVTEDEKAQMDAAIETANNFDRQKPTKADLAERATNLATAFALFKSQQKKPEAGTWYYISNTDEERTGDPADVATTKVFGNVIYAPTSNTADQRLTNGVDVLKHGYYDQETNEFDENATYNPTTMWRLVILSDTTYAIQNRATGTYLGVYYANAVGGLSAEPIAYKLDFVGPGEFNIVCQDSLNSNELPLHAAGNGTLVAVAGGYNTASSWTLSETDAELEAFTLPVTMNSISIITLPYDAGDIVGANSIDGTFFYAIKGMPNDSTIELTKLTSSEGIEAGTPLVMTVGDYTAFDPENTEETIIYVEAPAATDPAGGEYVTAGKTANGLVGVLNGATVTTGYGYFENAVLKSVVADGSAFINGQTGYINPDAIVNNEEGTAEITLHCTGKMITGVQSIEATKASKQGSIFSIDGKLIKKNALTTEGLEKGIYIVGKKKVAVK